MMLDVADRSNQRGRATHQNARAFQQVLHEVFGAPFALFDAATGVKVAGAGSDHGHAPGWDAEPAKVMELAEGGQALVVPWEGNTFRISLVLHTAGSPSLVAVGLVAALAEAPRGRALEQKRLQAWARDFSERLRLRDQLAVRARADEELRGQLTAAWEVTLALGEHMQRLRFNRHELRDRQRVLQSALRLSNVQALAWARQQPGCVPVVVGDSALGPEGVAALAGALANLAEAQGPEPYVCNQPQATSWGARFPRVDNLLAIPVPGPAGPSWLIALNKRGKSGSRHAEALPPPAQFRNSDAALLSPFASMLDMHSRTARKFDELRSLIVGMARCLTSAIDAKDAYTAGHSERVARLAVEIGREMQLPEEQLSDTYLVGLLHDVGKIGIRESVLCKAGPLTRDEFDHMKRHVTIGYRILQELDLLRHLLPGVLHHHERFDGKGYPEGLAGEQVPFLARLLAVADGIDAMSSDRPYRRALTQAEVVEELKKGAGTHWDPQVVAAALRCTDRLAAISQRGLGESLRQAVDMALRTGGSSSLGSA